LFFFRSFGKNLRLVFVCRQSNVFFFRTDFDYELTLRTDLYTSKHTQWYFFRCATSWGCCAVFTIPDSSVDAPEGKE